MNDSANPDRVSDDLKHAVTYAPEPFLSRDYLELEKKALWPKVWQLAERVEDFPNVGDFCTHNVADESVIIVRTDAETVKAARHEVERFPRNPAKSAPRAEGHELPSQPLPHAQSARAGAISSAAQE